MFDEGRTLLYIGQSANLHDRLNSYRHVHPDRDANRTVRLVHLVRRIEWEVCDSAVSAVLRENELLRTLRPRFNRMNVYPQACWFIGLPVEGDKVRLLLTHEPLEEGHTFGAFTGAFAAYASLGRLLFVLGREQVELGHFPARLLTGLPGESWS
jgi:excinuclease UvrABC nuclease subunit